MKFTVNGKAHFASDGGRKHDPSRRNLVLLHGSGVNQTFWSLQTRYLAYHGFNVVSVDLPGHGQSDRPPLGTVVELADWLAAFVEAAELQQTAVLGHSLGALMALEFAARHAACCDAIVLAGIAAKMPVHPTLLESAKVNDPLAIELIDSWCHARDNHIGGHPVPGGWMTGSTRRLQESAAPGVLWTDLNACNEFKDADRLLPNIKCPVCIISATEDRMTPAKAGRALCDRIVGAAYVLIQGAGHNMMLEKPTEFNVAVCQALSA